MIFNYSEFLVEQTLNLLLESRFVISNNFVKLLNQIDSPLSKLLIDNRDNDLELTMNYLEIADDEDSIEFIVDKKAKELKDTKKKYFEINYENELQNRDTANQLSHFQKSGGLLTRDGRSWHCSNPIAVLDALEFEDDKFYIPEQGEIGELVKITVDLDTGNDQARYFYHLKFKSGNCVISKNSPNNLSHNNVVEVSPAWVKSRQKISVGRAIRKILQSIGKEPDPQELEIFVNKWKAAWRRSKDAFRHFELVSGEDIAYWYDYHNYLYLSGDLGSSCMRDAPASYFDIYTRNPEKVSLLILKSPDDDSKIVARAIVWNLDSPEITLMDRVYFIYPKDLELYRQYAKSKGWFYKSLNNNSAHASLINPETGNIDTFDTIEITLANLPYRAFPYLDTLKYGIQTSRFFKLSNDKTKMDFNLEETDGTITSLDCEYCGGTGRRDCWACGGSCEQECSDCEGSGTQECSKCLNGEIPCPKCLNNRFGILDCQKCNATGKIEDKDCSDCSGKGILDCDRCDSKGRVTCDECGGSDETGCEGCDGSGNIRCQQCDGDGWFVCDEC